MMIPNEQSYTLIMIGCMIAVMAIRFRIRFNRNLDLGEGIAAVWFAGMALLMLMLGAVRLVG